MSQKRCIKGPVGESTRVSIKEQSLYIVQVQKVLDTFPACDISKQARTFQAPLTPFFSIFQLRRAQKLEAAK